MPKSPAPLSTTGKPRVEVRVDTTPRPAWQRRLAAWSRWLHIYLSMASFAVLFFGSPQESDEMPILGRFPKRDEFGLRRGDALRFEEQVA